MRLTVPQYKALEAVQRGRVLRSVMGDEFIAPGIRSQAVWVRLITDGPKENGSELTQMVLTDSGRMLLDRVKRGVPVPDPEMRPAFLDDD